MLKREYYIGGHKITTGCQTKFFFKYPQFLFFLMVSGLFLLVCYQVPLCPTNTIKIFLEWQPCYFSSRCFILFYYSLNSNIFCFSDIRKERTSLSYPKEMTRNDARLVSYLPRNNNPERGFDPVT